MTGVIFLSAWDLALAALLVLALAALSFSQRLGVERQLLMAAVRTVVQLLLIGVILKVLFAHVHLGWMALLATVMVLVAGREVMARQHRRFRGWWGFGLGSVSMFISSLSVTLLALTVFIEPRPWYLPQYAIPLLGMLLGNAMTGIALALDRLTHAVWRERAMVEARLLLGQNWNEAIAASRRDSLRTGLIPIINAMAAAGVVSLPGMMTGQILAGSPPMEAVKYQILIMFLIASATGFGATVAVWTGARHLFDERQRLRLDRLQAADRNTRKQKFFAR